MEARVVGHGWHVDLRWMRLWRLERFKVTVGKSWVACGAWRACMASDGACGRRRVGRHVEGSAPSWRVCCLVPAQRMRQGRAALGAVGLSNARSGKRRRCCWVAQPWARLLGLTSAGSGSGVFMVLVGRGYRLHEEIQSPLFFTGQRCHRCWSVRGGQAC
jgi:hypothetical protein